MTNRTLPSNNVVYDSRRDSSTGKKRAVFGTAGVSVAQRAKLFGPQIKATRPSFIEEQPTQNLTKFQQARRVFDENDFRRSRFTPPRDSHDDDRSEGFRRSFNEPKPNKIRFTPPRDFHDDDRSEGYRPLLKEPKPNKIRFTPPREMDDDDRSEGFRRLLNEPKPNKIRFTPPREMDDDDRSEGFRRPLKETNVNKTFPAPSKNIRNEGKSEGFRQPSSENNPNKSRQTFSSKIQENSSLNVENENNRNRNFSASSSRRSERKSNYSNSERFNINYEEIIGQPSYSFNRNPQGSFYEAPDFSRCQQFYPVRDPLESLYRNNLQNHFQTSENNFPTFDLGSLIQQIQQDYVENVRPYVSSIHYVENNSIFPGFGSTSCSSKARTNYEVIDREPKYYVNPKSKKIYQDQALSPINILAASKSNERNDSIRSGSVESVQSENQSTHEEENKADQSSNQSSSDEEEEEEEKVEVIKTAPPVVSSQRKSPTPTESSSSSENDSDDESESSPSEDESDRKKVKPLKKENQKFSPPVRSTVDPLPQTEPDKSQNFITTKKSRFAFFKKIFRRK